VPETLRTFRDSVINVLPSVPGLRVDSLERSCVLGWVPVEWQKGRSPKEIIDPVNPKLIACVDFPF